MGEIVATVLVFVGLIALVVGVIALVRGHIGWARIPNRRTAVIVSVIAFGVMLTGGALTPASPAPTSDRILTTSTPAPAPTSSSTTTARTTTITTTTTTSVPPARLTTTTPPPPPITTTLEPTLTLAPMTPTEVAIAPFVPAPAVPAYTPPPAPSRGTTGGNSGGGGDCAGGYINTAGNCIPSPRQAPSAPAGATAKCSDGTYSFSQSRRGTCSGHGGVASWL